MTISQRNVMILHFFICMSPHTAEEQSSSYLLPNIRGTDNGSFAQRPSEIAWIPLLEVVRAPSVIGLLEYRNAVVLGLGVTRSLLQVPASSQDLNEKY